MKDCSVQRSVEMYRGEQGMINNLSAAGNYAGNYCRWNLSVFPIKEKKRILDIGCGPCLYFDAIFAYNPEFYFATDYNKNFLDMARKRISGLSKCRVEQLDIICVPEPIPFLMGQKFDYVLCFDVLEHMRDDVAGLKNIHKIMLTTSTHDLFVRVPALPLIFGRNDLAIGHFRRYTKKNLRSALEAAGFEVRRMRYQNIIGIIPWFVVGRICQRSLAVAPREGRLFEKIVPMLRWIESVIPPPIGLSLYCEAVPRDRFSKESPNKI